LSSKANLVSPFVLVVMSKVTCPLWKKKERSVFTPHVCFFFLAVVDYASAGEHEKAAEFFKEEYQVDHFISTLETPFVSIMDGVTSKLALAVLNELSTNESCTILYSGWWCRS
jgi:hypothetical protein